MPGLLERWYAERKTLQAKKKEAKQMKRLHFGIKDSWLKRLTNSLYGAILIQDVDSLNKRIGQSTTLTGRAITKHMGEQTNLVYREYDSTGDTIVYGDTDPVYHPF